MMSRWSVIASAMVALGALSGAAAYQHAAPRQDQRTGAWQEIAWPFPRDGWPAGRAFRCGAAACGEVELYLRPKTIATVVWLTMMRSTASPISIS
jgi:hypothetical protein